MEKVDKVYHTKRTIFWRSNGLEKYQFFVNVNYCTIAITILKKIKHLKRSDQIGYFN